MNGDTDTLGAMAGAIAKSFYLQLGCVPKAILREFLDIELFDIWKMIKSYTDKCNSRNRSSYRDEQNALI